MPRQQDIDQFKDNALGIYDDELRRIFSGATNGHRRTVLAKELIRRNRRFLVSTISEWTGAREKVVVPVISKFFERCRELQLAQSSESEGYSLAALTAFGTTVVMNYLYTGRYIPD